MKSKIKVLFMVAVICTIFSACGKEEKEYNDKVVKLEAYKSFANGLAVESEEVSEGSMLYYYDYKNQKEVYACGQANCSHSTSEYKDGKINCNAYIQYGALYPFVYNDKLYYFVQPTNDNAVLWKSNTDGTEKEKVADTGIKLYEGAQCLLANGKVYVASALDKEISINEHSSYSSTVQSEVYEIDLSSRTVSKLTDLGEKPACDCTNINYFDGVLYLRYMITEKTYKEGGFKSYDEYEKWLSSKQYSYGDDIKRLGKKINTYTYNLKTGKMEKLKTGYKFIDKALGVDKEIKDYDYFYVIYADTEKIYYIDPTSTEYIISCYNLKTKQTKDVFKGDQICYSYKNKKIYLSVTEKEQSDTKPSIKTNFKVKPKYYIYDIEKEKLIQQNYGEDGKFYYVIDENQDGLLAYETDFNENYLFIDEHRFTEISKDQVTE